jgi:tRNA (mo5U34)-methyltransferase
MMPPPQYPARLVFRLRRRAASPLSDELEAELRSGTPWMYPWELAPGVSAPLVGPGLPAVHRTRRELVEPIARAALRKGGRAIDIACHEGWFAHRLLEWGAREVVAVDIREVNVRRARLLRDHFGISSDRLKIERADVYELRADDLGRFDVVLILGLIYHLENPIGAIRTARSLTQGVCLLETQLTRQEAPIRTGWGIPDEFTDEPASWAARFEAPEEQDTQPLAAFGGVISLIPNRAAVVQAMTVAGFTGVEAIEAEDGHDPQYLAGDRGVFAGRA